MASPLEKLVRKADALAVSADRLVAETLRGIRGELAVLAKELKLASSAADRETAYKAIRTRMAKLAVRLDRLLAAQHQLAAKTAARAASDMTGVEIKYSARHAQAVLELVSPAQGENLAAVFTDRMSQSLVNTLRESVVAVLREQAVAGGSVKDAARAMQERWDAALENETPRFTDAAGRVWDTKTYFMMNARTSTMRVYNDCLVDDVARQTGSDLMRISRGGSDPHCACAAWEGQIVSLSGKTKGFPTYEDARRGGCFHPNCVHTLEVVDEYADADEIALQKAHPVAKADAADPDAQRARKYARDQERKRKTEGLTAEEARLAVDRDNLAAAIRAGLLRADAKALVAKLTDAQVSALCPDGMPPRFAPVKKVPGGTRANPKYEPERWRRGTRGGVVHIARDTDAAHLVAVAKLAEAAESKEKSAAPKGWTPSTPLEKETDALMRKLGVAHTDKPLDIAGTNPNYKKGKEWQINCQRCVPACEARFRGYDVTAKPKPMAFDSRAGKLVPDGNDEMFADVNRDSIAEMLFPAFDHVSPIHYRKKSDIEKQMAGWGDGARAQVVCMWKTKSGGLSGHTFMACQINGKTHFLDPQNGDKDCSGYFPGIRTRGEAALFNNFARIDDRPFSARVRFCAGSADYIEKLDV